MELIAGDGIFRVRLVTPIVVEDGLAYYYRHISIDQSEDISHMNITSSPSQFLTN